MKKISISAALWISVILGMNAENDQDQENKKIKIDFSGFVRYDVTLDTRQTVNAREGIYLLYPAKPLWDKDHQDINGVSHFNMTTINSNIKLNLTGPDLFNAASKAYFEVDFWGSEINKNIDLNHIRIRHAYIQLNWKATELLLGQYWNPMTAPGFFPRVVSSNSGVPFHPISRNPQIRIRQNLGQMQLIGCLLTQRDSYSTGPNGADSKYMRNSGVPMAHLQLQYGNKASTFHVGMGVDYKKVLPELYTTYEEELIKTGKKSTLSSFSYMAFMDIITRFLSIRMQGVYACNGHDIQLLGGYALREITNAAKGEKEYTNMRALSGWCDLQTNGKTIKGGLFCGYAKNIGAGEWIEGPIYARGADIDNVFRLSSRIVYEKKAMTISFECEYTTADYGMENGDRKGGVTNTNQVANTRALLSVKYNF